MTFTSTVSAAPAMTMQMTIHAVIISACEPDLRGRAQLRPEAWLEKPFRCETLLEVVKKYVTPERGGLIDS